jgi:hypothetical protein
VSELDYMWWWFEGQLRQLETEIAECMAAPGNDCWSYTVRDSTLVSGQAKFLGVWKQAERPHHHGYVNLPEKGV